MRSREAGATPDASITRLAANDLPRAFRASIGAGDAASAAGAFIDAAQHLDRAVQLVDVVPDASESVDGGRSGLLRLAAEATRYAGNPARAVGLWEAAIAALPPDARPQDRATLLLGLAVDANETFANDLALASTQEANELLADEAPSRLRALAFADLARDLYNLNRPDEASAANEQAIEMAVKVGDRRVEALARGRLELDRFRQDDPGERWDQMEIALAIARRPAIASVVQLRVHECRLGARTRRGGWSGSRPPGVGGDRRSRASSGCRPSRWRRGGSVLSLAGRALDRGAQRARRSGARRSRPQRPQ